MNRKTDWLANMIKVLLSISILVALGGPPGHIALGDMSDPTTLHAAGRGNPWVNLLDGRAQPVPPSTLAGAKVQPLTLAAADLDEDGALDLVSGYATGTGGILLTWRGNKALAHTLQASEEPFFFQAQSLSLPFAPNLLGAGDFDGDGHQDVVAATYGVAALTLLPGDGAGNLGAVQTLPLPGPVTALAVGDVNRRDGLADMLLGVTTDSGPQLLLFGSPQGAWHAQPEALDLPAPAAAIAVGQLDEEYPIDVAIAAGRDLLILAGRDRGRTPQAAVRSYPQSSDIASLAVGDFLAGDGGQSEIALLAADGAIHILDPDGAPRRSLPAATGGGVRLLAAQVSSLPAADLLLLDAAGRQVQILNADGRWNSPAGMQPIGVEGPLAVLDAPGAPAAVLPLRLNGDALSDLVILAEGAAAPLVSPTAPVNTFVVVDDSDDDDENPGDGQCDITSHGIFLCTLRAAIQEANASPGADSITFAIQLYFRDDYPETDMPTIAPGNPLPDIAEAVTIDGSTDFWDDYVELSGVNLGSSADGLRITGATGVTIRGMLINRFRGNGIYALTLSNVIEGNIIGLDQAGNTGAGNGTGILAYSESTIRNNVISGNDYHGIAIYGDENQIIGNLIGLYDDGSGEQTRANGKNGISLFLGADNNVIGTANSGEGNTISGNLWNGVAIADSGSEGNQVRYNTIGLNSAEDEKYPNIESGVYVENAPSNSISHNVIAGNFRYGIQITGSDAASNMVNGNTIGTNADGDALGNQLHGVRLDDGAHDNTIGTNNVIAHNGLDGVNIQNADDNRVNGNLIGTNLNGDPLGNGRDGVHIYQGAGNEIASTNYPNLIGRQSRHGVYIGGAGAVDNELRYNTIEANQEHGIFLDIGADNTAIGGGDLTISDNGSDGLQIASSNNTVQDVDTTNNGGNGITVFGDDNLVEGTRVDFNSNEGINLYGDRNELYGNTIGLAENGVNCAPNLGKGIAIPGNDNTIGGATATERNLISCNGDGISIEGNGNQVLGNYIGTNDSGTAALGNFGDGILITGDNNTIGGSASGAGNVISASEDDDGIEIQGDDNTVQGNLIGLDKNGSGDLGNAGHGIHINGGNDNNIGGMLSGEGNTIAYNQVGVYVTGGTGNRILGNVIHSHAGLGIDLSPAGVTPNDTGDDDSGANNLQNFPVISSVVVSDTTIIQGTFSGQPNTVYTLQIYANDSCDSSGYGEGEQLLIQSIGSSNAYGYLNFTHTVADTTVAGKYVVATITDPNDNTSEFSQCVYAQSWGGGAIFTVNQTNDAADLAPGDGVCDSSASSGEQCTLRAAIQEANTLAGPNSIILPAGLYRLMLANASGDEDAAATGDLDITEDLALIGDGADMTTIEINSALDDRVFEVSSGQDVSISGVTIMGGNTASYGGGIENRGTLTLEAVSVQENSASLGGGIFNQGTLTLTNSALISNTASSGGGGLYHNGANLSALINATVSGNQADGYGGGIYSIMGTTVLNNVTVVYNTADADNSGSGDGGGMYYPGGTAFTVKNSLIAENVDRSQGGFPNGYADCRGTFDSEGYNLIGDRAYNDPNIGCQGFDATGDQVGGYQVGAHYLTYPAGVGPLQYNGGPTLNHAPISPDMGFAVDRGNPATPGSGGGACTGFDQRGQPRTIDGDFDGSGRCDRGAVEYIPVTISVSDASGLEGGNAVFELGLSEPAPITATVYYSTPGGTALAGQDYVSVTGYVTFPIGAVSRTVTVMLLDDSLNEDDEEFFFNLYADYHALIGDAQGRGVIQDDDSSPHLAIADVTLTEGDAGTLSQAVLNVTLNQASGQEISVAYTTSPGSATEDEDYLFHSGRLIFPPGETSQSLNTIILGDDLAEGDETLTVILSDPVNAGLSDAQGLITITDDDVAALSIADIEIFEGDSGTKPAYLDVRLSAASVQTITVDYATADGSATAGSDYAAASGTLTFAPAQTKQTISITLHGDVEVEPHEAFSVILSNPGGGAVLGDEEGVVTILDNDGEFVYLPLVLRGP